MEDLSAAANDPVYDNCLVVHPDSGQPAVRYVHMGPNGRDGSYPYDASECPGGGCSMARAVNGGRFAGNCALGLAKPQIEG